MGAKLIHPKRGAVNEKIVVPIIDRFSVTFFVFLFCLRYQTLKMPAFLENGKIVIITAGRYAGRKAVIVKMHLEGTKERAYGHAVVAGIDRYPLPVTRSMNKRKLAKRTRVKPFVKVVNLNHIMPTRYTYSVDLKAQVNTGTLKHGQRSYARRHVRKVFEERHRAGKSQWFFKKLRF